MTNSVEKHHADYTSFSDSSKKETLETLVMSYDALAASQTNWVCNLSNASSLLWHAYKSLGINVNWTGFYLTHKENSMLLGPFQGKVACQEIDFGRGVCGAAASSQKTQVVEDVNKFPGHIACDGETKSEIVVPIISKDEKTLGVIDLDCLDYSAFDEVDRKYLEQLAARIVETCIF